MKLEDIAMQNIISQTDLLAMINKSPCGVIVHDSDTDAILYANPASLRVAQAVQNLPVIAIGYMEPIPNGTKLFGNSLKEKRISHPDLANDYEVVRDTIDWEGLPADLYYLIPVFA